MGEKEAGRLKEKDTAKVWRTKRWVCKIKPRS